MEALSTSMPSYGRLSNVDGLLMLLALVSLEASSHSKSGRSIGTCLAHPIQREWHPGNYKTQLARQQRPLVWASRGRWNHSKRRMCLSATTNLFAARQPAALEQCRDLLATGISTVLAARAVTPTMQPFLSPASSGGGPCEEHGSVHGATAIGQQVSRAARSTTPPTTWEAEAHLATSAHRQRAAQAQPALLQPQAATTRMVHALSLRCTGRTKWSSCSAPPAQTRQRMLQWLQAEKLELQSSHL